MRLSGNSGPEKILWARSSTFVNWFLIGIFVIICARIALFGATPPAWAEPTPAPSSQAFPVLVREGIDFFENNELEDALQTFESAAVIYPDNHVIPYYLGMINLKQGERREAIVQWEKYLRLAPQDKNVEMISKYLTVLQRREAEDFARKAVEKEQQGQIGPVDDDTVAVTTFKNLGSKKLDPLGKGMAALIIADLSLFKDIKVVEREKLQALLAEMKLGSSGLVDEKSAPRVGKLLKAKYVTSGTLADQDEEKLRMASILFDAALNAPSGFQNIDGALNRFYDLEKQIACRIATDLGRNCDPAPKGFDKIHTKSLPALIDYSQGVNLADQGKYNEARPKYESALKADPQFDLARRALMATPVAAMLLMSDSQMVAKASAGAPAPPTTASVPVKEEGPGTTSNGLWGTGIGTTTAIAGGAVLVGGIVAAAALSGGSDGGGGSGGAADGIAGTWNGTYDVQSGEDHDGNDRSLTLTLTQNGSDISGSITVLGSECISEGTIGSGTLDGTSILLQISVTNGSAGSAELEATLDNSSRTMRGNLTISSSGSCSGTRLSFDEVKETGSGRVSF